MTDAGKLNNSIKDNVNGYREEETHERSVQKITSWAVRKRDTVVEERGKLTTCGTRSFLTHCFHRFRRRAKTMCRMIEILTSKCSMK